jgi:hypothetical protein
MRNFETRVKVLFPPTSQGVTRDQFLRSKQDSGFPMKSECMNTLCPASFQVPWSRAAIIPSS